MNTDLASAMHRAVRPWPSRVRLTFFAAPLLLAACGGWWEEDTKADAAAAADAVAAAPSPSPSPSPAPAPAPAPAPITLSNGLGDLEIEISGIGTKSPSAAVRWDEASQRMRTLAASGLANALASTPMATGLDLKASSISTIDANGYRYLTATFLVRNAQACSTPGTCPAYTVARTNITLMAAVGVPIPGTPFTRFLKQDDTPASTTLAAQLLPSHGMQTAPGGVAVDSRLASMQAYREDELPAISGVELLPYGYVVTNSADGSRLLPANPGAHQFDGWVTIGYRIPLQTNSADNPFKITVRIRAVEDSNTRVTQSLDETDASVAARAAALGTSDIAVLCNRRSRVATANPICGVRVAGTSSAPVTFLDGAPPPVPTIISAPTDQLTATLRPSIILGASTAMQFPSANTLKVFGSQSGPRTATLAGNYTGQWPFLGTSYRLGFSVDSDSKPFFPGETISFVATSGIASYTNLPLKPFVGSMVARGSASGSAGDFPGKTWPAGDVPVAIASADLDGDGYPDLVVANLFSNNVSVMRGDGRGGFAAAVQYTAGTRPTGVAVADLNGDGKLDVVTSNDAAANVTVLMGDGKGGLASGVSCSCSLPSAGSSAVAIGDINRDGKPDVVLTHPTTNAVTVLFGAGGSGLSWGNTQTLSTPSGAQHVTLGDVNRDGRLDVVTANSGNTISVMLNNGSFLNAASSYVAGNFPSQVALGDLNGDGILDAVTADIAGNSVSVMLGNASGGFGTPASFPADNFTRSVALHDVNGDGSLDVIATNSNAHTVTVLLGSGTGSFVSTTQFSSAGSGPTGAVLLDVNRDGRPDIVTVNRNSNDVGLLLARGAGDYFAIQRYSGPTTANTLLADLNGDGHLDLITRGDGTLSVRLGFGATGMGFPMLTNLGGQGSGVMAVGDLNGDGHLDILTDNTGGTVSILLNNGFGSFFIAPPLQLTEAAQHLLLGDLNGDGNLDLVVADQTGSIGVLLGNGVGGFGAAVLWPAGLDAARVALGDLDGDGVLDIVVADRAGTAVNLLRGLGEGTFASPVLIAGASGDVLDLAIGDVTGDGLPDVVIAGPWGISIAKGLGNASFQVLSTLPGAASSIALADVNGDAYLDIVACRSYAANLGVFKSNRKGGFEPQATYPLPTATRSCAVGDLNEDGVLDIVAGSLPTADTSVLYGR